MSNIIVPDTGNLLLLTWALQTTSTPENLILKLYANNYLPVETSTASNFTECSFTGYSAQTMSRATWGTPTTVTPTASSTYGSALSWTCGATGQTVYGYYVVGATSGNLVWAQGFDTPRSLVSGDNLTLTPVFTMKSQN